MINLSEIEKREIDEMLDKAEELVDKYGIYFHEAQDVVEGRISLEKAIKKHIRYEKRKKKERRIDGKCKKKQ